MNFSEEERKYLFALVENVLEQCVKNGKELTELTFPDLPSKKLEEKAGAFVTYYLKKGGNKTLRGCIGLMEGIYPLWETVAKMAHAAAFSDVRFLPVSKEELPFIDWEITVLTPFVPCPDIDGIVLGKHGIMFHCGRHRSVFLPQVPAEQGWNKEQTFEHLAVKAGLAPQDWKKEGVKFYTFEGTVLER